jgi:hypothetical protein
MKIINFFPHQIEMKAAKRNATTLLKVIYLKRLKAEKL